MTCYKPATPRALFGLTAVMMTAITLGALVVVPAKLEFVNADPSSMAAGAMVTKTTTEVVNAPIYTNAPRSLTTDSRDRRDDASVQTDNRAFNIRNRRPEIHASAKQAR